MASRLYLGDSIEIMRSLPDASIDCIITDPPYNIGNFMLKRNTNLVKMRKNAFAYAGWDNLEHEDWLNQMDSFLQECHRVLKKKGTLIIFMAIIKIEKLVEIAQKHKFYYKTTGIWHKTNPMPRNMKIQFVNSTECWIYMINDGTSGTFNYNGKMQHDFLESAVCPLREQKQGKHPTQKPLKIMKDLISLVSKSGDVILDPFMGSGSTCVASALLDREYIGIDLSEEYYNIAKARLNNLDEVK